MKSNAAAARSDEPPFGAGDVVDFLQMSGETFQTWLNRGIVPYEVVERGGRTYRRFGLRELTTIAIIRTLHRMGFEPSKARDLAKLVEEASSQVNQAYGPAKLRRLAGEQVFIPAVLAIAGERWGVYGPAATAGTMLADLREGGGEADGFIVLDLDAIDRDVMEVWTAAKRRMNQKEA